MSDDLVKRYRQLQEVIGGCHDGYCVVRKPKGMHTNGGCACLEDLRLHERSRFGHLLRCAQEIADRIEELEAENRLLRDAVYIDDLTVTMQADDRSKAMVAMKRALDFLNADMPTEAKTALRTTLAELTGGDNGQDS